MTAIFFICVYLLNNGDIPGIDWRKIARLSQKDRHEAIKKIKINNPLNFWVQGKAKSLGAFCLEVEKLTHSSKPNYDKIKKILSSLIEDE